MCDSCGYPSLDLRTRADINTASLNMADDARCGTSIHGQEAQLCLSRMYTFRQAMRLETLCTSLLHIQERRGISCPSLFTASFGTQQLECWNLGVYYQRITQKPLGPGGVDVHIDESAMYQLEESINFATTRHESKTVLNDVISVTASMQTQETKWNDSKHLSANPGCGEFQPSSTNLSHYNIDDPLLLSDYPIQEGSDLPAMRAWISASTSPPGGVFGRKVCSAYGRPPVWSAD